MSPVSPCALVSKQEYNRRSRAAERLALGENPDGLESRSGRGIADGDEDLEGDGHDDANCDSGPDGAWPKSMGGTSKALCGSSNHGGE